MDFDFSQFGNMAPFVAVAVTGLTLLWKIIERKDKEIKETNEKVLLAFNEQTKVNSELKSVLQNHNQILLTNKKEAKEHRESLADWVVEQFEGNNKPRKGSR